MDLDKLTNEEEKILATGKLLAYCDDRIIIEVLYSLSFIFCPHKWEFVKLTSDIMFQSDKFK